MTPVDLLECLGRFIKEKTEDIILQVRVNKNNPDAEKERAADVYKMQLPEKEDATGKIPYILLQLVTGKDDRPQGETADEATCQIRLVFATYSEDGQQGAYDVLNLILRIRSELEKIGVLDERYVLKMPFEYIVYTDQPKPYYLGEAMTNWSIPTIKREVEEIWQ
jgi:hypothetical protein